MSEILSGPSQRGSQTQAKYDDRYELAILTRVSDNEGWSDERFTAALKKLAETKKDTTASPRAPTTEISTAPSQGQNGLDSIKKRQETVRITRQADSEGWSDDKTLAALRLRNSIHYELRERKPALAGAAELQSLSTST